MLSNNRNLNIILWIGGAIVTLFVLGFIYSTFFRPTIASSAGNSMGLLFAGLIFGAVIMILIWKLSNAGNKQLPKENSHTIVESMRKVFKIVCAEGHFNELYNFEETKRLFGFIPSTRRALVIIEAKVLIGYDFEKCVWETDEVNQKIKLVSFPQPQIISTEADYKYYNFDENIFNLLGRQDLTRIQANGKKQVEMAAIKSHLPKIAADQMRMLLTEVVQSKNWQIDDMYKINEEDKSLLNTNNK